MKRSDLRNPLQTRGKKPANERLSEPPITVSLCGRFHVEVAGATADVERLRGRQVRVAFAYLLLQQGRPVPREELAEAVWGEFPSATWEKGLTVLVSKLRAVLADWGLDGQRLLTNAFGCYRLDLPDGTRIDMLDGTQSAEEARRALAVGELARAEAEGERAAALARLQFLPGEDRTWVEERRREQEDVLSSALDSLSAVALRTGRPALAARYAHEAVALEPFRESAHRRLMEAHDAAGNRAEALRVYERCRRLLAEELGAYPSSETEAVYRRLLEAQAPAAPVPAVDRRRGAVYALLVFVVATAASAIVVLTRGGGTGSVVVVPDSVAVVDANTHRIVADVRVGARPVAVATAADAVWIANADDGTVSHVDPATKQVVKTIGIGGEVSDIASGYGAVWVAGGNEGTVTRIDPRLDAVQATIHLGKRNPLDPQPVFAIAAGAGGVWATSGARIVEIDPRTNAVARRIRIGSVFALTVGANAVWVTTVSEHIYRIDATSGTVTAETSAPAPVYDVAAARGTLWALLSIGRGEIWRLDANTVSARGTTRTGAHPEALCLTADGVWIADGGGVLTRIDPTTGKIAATVRVGGRPDAVGAGGGLIWVAVARRAVT
jgi:DNA-binding SARP family transcriptional activator/glutamine cyclotransferase